MSKQRSYFTIAWLGGIAVLTAGGWAFVYAHEHDPTPEADPMAVHLLSHSHYELLHYGGLALAALGVLSMLWAMFSAVRNSS
jgi:hypothetical protein